MLQLDSSYPSDVVMPERTITIRAEDLQHAREMLREQAAGDRELLLDLTAFGADMERISAVAARLMFVEDLARQLA